MIPKTSSRAVIRACGLALVVLLAVALALRAYGKHRLAAADARLDAALAPYTAASWASPKVPDEENAAIFLRAGAAALIENVQERSFVGSLALKPVSKWTNDERTRLGAVLEKNGPALELLHRGGALSRSSFGLTAGELWFDEIKQMPLIPLVNAARLCVAEGGLARDRHDQAGLLRSAATVAAFARSLEIEAPLIAKLLGAGLERMALRLVHEAAADPATGRETLAMLRRFVGTNDLHEEWKRCLAAEHVVARTPRAMEEAELALKAGGSSWRVRLTEPVLRDLAEAQATLTLASIVGLIDQPYGAWSEDARAGRVGPTSWQNPMGRLRTSSLVNAASRFQMALSQRRLARLALALRLEATERGSYPDSLTGFSEASVADPFTGAALRYERRADGSAVLEVPGAEELFTEMSRGVPNSCPFRWELPAPPPRTTSHDPLTTGH